MSLKTTSTLMPPSLSRNRLAALAGELVALNVNVIVTYSTIGMMAAHQATDSIPIVVAVGSNPVDYGLAKSLARPGGNVTGTSMFLPEVGVKQLELLKQLNPAITRIGLMVVRDSPSNAVFLKVVRAAAAALGLELFVSEVANAKEFESLLFSWQAAKVQAAISSSQASSSPSMIATRAIVNT